MVHGLMCRRLEVRTVCLRTGGIGARVAMAHVKVELSDSELEEVRDLLRRYQREEVDEREVLERVGEIYDRVRHRVNIVV